ncbi:hypothetical protein HPB50_026077 [Hyalomma asiaticum]|uniref:Uncharacterized protein n=1 Tax=Hyalomma asiaticum TaxID=266040 RepID=A0ACB7RKT7_HYAAI|nr:hypothetical protein HPB50_026077 [Hyalomma asiaticum]
MPAAAPAQPAAYPSDALIASLLATLESVGSFLPVDHPLLAVCPKFTQSCTLYGYACIRRIVASGTLSHGTQQCRCCSRRLERQLVCRWLWHGVADAAVLVLPHVCRLWRVVVACLLRIHIAVTVGVALESSQVLPTQHTGCWSASRDTSTRSAAARLQPDPCSSWPVTVRHTYSMTGHITTVYIVCTHAIKRGFVTSAISHRQAGLAAARELQSLSTLGGNSAPLFVGRSQWNAARPTGLAEDATKTDVLSGHHRASSAVPEEQRRMSRFSHSCHRCAFCGKAFEFECCLVRHMRIYTGERPFQCHICLVAFNDKSALNKHLLIHSVYAAGVTSPATCRPLSINHGAARDSGAMEIPTTAMAHVESTPACILLATLCG